MKRLLAGLLAALLILEAPGSAAWAAAVRLRAPAARPISLGAPTLSAAPSLRLTPTLIAPTFGIAPIAVPAVAPVPAVAAPAVAVPAVEPALQAAGRLAEPGAQEQSAPAYFDLSAPRPADTAVAGVEGSGGESLPPSGGGNGNSGASEPPAPKGPRKLPRSLWGLFWGHHIFTVFGVNFHVLSQPFLVKDALGMGTATMGLVRNIHMGAMALVNFLPIGYLIDKTDLRVVYIATTLARAALMGAIPMIFMSGGLTFTALALIVAANPLFQSTMIVADSAGRKAFLGSDEKLNKDAAATLSKWDSVAGMVMPIVAGWVIGGLVGWLGLGGYAAAYGIYAGLLAASIPFYWTMVRDPRMPENDKMSLAKFAGQTVTFMAALALSLVAPLAYASRWAAPERLKKGKGALRYAAAVLAGALLLPFKLPWTALKGLRAWLFGPKSQDKLLERAAKSLDPFKPMQGLAFILRSKVLSVLTAVMAVEVFLLDALPFVILPNLISDALMAGAPAFSGFWAAQLGTAGGIMGLLFAVEYAGRFLASRRLESEKGDAIIERAGHRRFYRLASLASLTAWALLIPVLLPVSFWVGLAVVAAVMFAIQFFHAPIAIIIEPIKRRHMPDDMLARIESSVFMVDVAAESIGALMLGLLLDFYGLTPALIATGVALTATAVLQWKVPGWLDLPKAKR